eukprot:335250-Lingulodinium_polyedra.AAC.1
MAACAHCASAWGWKPARQARCALSSSSTALRSVSSSSRGAGLRAGCAAGGATWRGCWHLRQWARLAQLPSQPQP